MVGKARLNGRRILGAAAGIAFAAAASQGHALTITPFFDSSITGMANSALIEGRINSAIGFYSQFTNDADVKVIFKIGNTGLGQNASTIYGPVQYVDAVTLLALDSAAHPENAILPIALANMPYGNHQNLGMLSANLRALGISDAFGVFGTDGSFNMGGDYDAIVTLSNVAGRIAYGDTVDPGQYGANQVIQHEVDEVLGFGGAGSLIGSGFGLMGVEDLYRYNGVHSASFSTSTTEHAYLSIDGGVTNLVDLNQNGIGDYGDFAKTSCTVGAVQHVQDWAGCPQPVTGQFGLTRDSVEVIGLQAAGYNLAVPEPSTWALLIGGFGLTGAMLRRRRGLYSPKPIQG